MVNVYSLSTLCVIWVWRKRQSKIVFFQCQYYNRNRILHSSFLCECEIVMDGFIWGHYDLAHLSSFSSGNREET